MVLVWYGDSQSGSLQELVRLRNWCSTEIGLEQEFVNFMFIVQLLTINWSLTLFRCQLTMLVLESMFPTLLI